MKNKYKPWTEKENSYLRRVYPKHGPHYCAQKLQRTPEATRKHAEKLTLQSGITNNHIPLVWIAARGQQGHHLTSARKQAAKDGVLKHHPGRYVTYTIPTWWADKYLAHKEQQQQLDAERHNWLTLKQIAQQAQMKSKTLEAQMRNNTKLGAIIKKHVTHYTQHHKPGKPKRYHPQETHKALQIWKHKQ